MARLCLSLLLLLLIASAASAVTMAWTPIGNPGNACDPQSEGCFGAVPYSYSIGTYEVTNAQYADFRNAKAASDPLGLYNSESGVAQGGVSGSFTYTAIAGREDMPVIFVSFYDALRFANWMNNGQGNGDTETGAYTLLGGTAIPSNGTSVQRNPGATIFLTSEDEWYKSAYFDPSTDSYFDYPAGSDMQIACAMPGATPNTANCGNAVVNLTAVGSYTGSASPYGTFDQGGNLIEWNEVIIGTGGRGLRGASYINDANLLAASVRGGINPSLHVGNVGFRAAMIPGGYIPEPGTGLLVIAGSLGLAGWRRARA